MWSRERILIIIPATLLLGSLLLSTFPQLTYIPCFSLVSEQRTEEDFLEWMIKQQERRARVARTCASDPSLRNSQRASGGMEYSFLFDPDHNLLGCLQPKVKLLTSFWTLFYQGWIDDLASAFCVSGKWEKANAIGTAQQTRSGKYIMVRRYADI